MVRILLERARWATLTAADRDATMKGSWLAPAFAGGAARRNRWRPRPSTPPPSPSRRRSPSASPTAPSTRSRTSPPRCPTRRGKALRVFVQAGGCSGFQYGFTFDDAKETDHVLAVSGIKVLVDKTSAMKLNGSTVDWIEDFRGAGFSVENPNAARRLRLRQELRLIRIPRTMTTAPVRGPSPSPGPAGSPPREPAASLPSPSSS